MSHVDGDRATTTMRLVVTGASGFIGRYVVQQALARGWDVLAIGRGSCPQPLPAGLRYWQLADAAAPTLPDDWVSRPFALIHLAWDTSRAPRYAVHAQQAQRLAELVEAFHELGLEQAIGLGSAEEFGAVSGTIGASDAPLGPLTPYGLGKRMASQLLAAWSARCDVPALWLCPMLVYGPGQSGTMVLPYALRQAIRGERAQFSDGRQTRDLVYVEDVAAAILLAAERRPDGFQRLMLGTGAAAPVRNAILEIARQFGVENRFEMGALARRPGEPAEQRAEVDATRSALGWRAETSWQTGVARMCQSARDTLVRAALLGDDSAARTWLPHVPQSALPPGGAGAITLPPQHISQALAICGTDQASSNATLGILPI